MRKYTDIRNFKLEVGVWYDSQNLPKSTKLSGKRGLKRIAIFSEEYPNKLFKVICDAKPDIVFFAYNGVCSHKKVENDRVDFSNGKKYKPDLNPDDELKFIILENKTNNEN